MRDDDLDGGDLPTSSKQAAVVGVTATGVGPPIRGGGGSSGGGSSGGGSDGGGGGGGSSGPPSGHGRPAGAAKGAIFREVVMAKVREKAEQEKAAQEVAAGRTTGTVK